MAEQGGNPGPQPQLVGGEMAHGTDAPTPLGVLADVVAEPMQAAASVLLIGPAAAQLAGFHATTTVLVRRVGDARTLAQQEVRVLAGGLDRLPSEEQADLVIQLDPPERVLTPDSPGLSHVQVVQLAAGHVAPGGRLIALVPGPLGRDRAAAAPDPDSDDAWWMGTNGYNERPPVLHELPWPPTHLVVNRNGRPVIAATLAALATATGTDELRSACTGDTVARTALDAGVLVDLADGWLVDLPGRPTPQAAVWTSPTDPGPAARHSPGPDGRIERLTGELRLRDTQLAALRAVLEQQLRRVRALEHAMATEHGSLAHRTLWVLTAPMSRIVEAVRARRHH